MLATQVLQAEMMLIFLGITDYCLRSIISVNSVQSGMLNVFPSVRPSTLAPSVTFLVSPASRLVLSFLGDSHRAGRDFLSALLPL